MRSRFNPNFPYPNSLLRVPNPRHQRTPHNLPPRNPTPPPLLPLLNLMLLPFLSRILENSLMMPNQFSSLLSTVQPFENVKMTGIGDGVEAVRAGFGNPSHQLIKFVRKGERKEGKERRRQV